MVNRALSSSPIVFQRATLACPAGVAASCLRSGRVTNSSTLDAISTDAQDAMFSFQSLASSGANVTDHQNIPSVRRGLNIRYQYAFI